MRRGPRQTLRYHLGMMPPSARFRLVTLVAGLLLTIAWMAPSSRADATQARLRTVSHPVLLNIGDSLTLQAGADPKSGTVLGVKWKVADFAASGAAPCDWLRNGGLIRHLTGAPTLGAYLRALHPTVVTVETAGNNVSQCMRDGGAPIPQDSALYLERYQSDLSTLFALLGRYDRRTVFLAAPPMAYYVPAGAERILEMVQTTLTPRFKNLRVNLGPRLALSGASGAFALYLPCLATETETLGCTNAEIQVRSYDGVHFCPARVDQLLGTCPVYASGAYRWSHAVLESVSKLQPSLPYFRRP